MRIALWDVWQNHKLTIFLTFRGSGYHVLNLKDAGEAVTVILEHGNTPDIPLFLLLELAEIDSSAVDIMVELVRTVAELGRVGASWAVWTHHNKVSRSGLATG